MTPDSPAELQIFAQLDPITVSKPFGLQLILCDETDAAFTLAADAWMPRHKHGMNYTPNVRPVDERNFAISNLVFHMPGLWQLRVNIQPEGASQTTTYLLDVEVK